MRMRILLLAALSATGVLQAAEGEGGIVRHTLQPWEQDIGYTGVLQVGDTLHVSGVTCAGADMETAVAACYRTLEGILRRFGATSDQVVRETVYTTDMDALIRAIPERKTFFPDARYPAATWVEVRRLFRPEYRLEVEWTVQLR